MRKLKITSLLATSILTISMLFGCNSNSDVATSSNQDGNVTITFLNSKGEIATQVEDAAVKFTEENPNIQVEIVTLGAGQSPFEKVSALYASGNAPSIIMLDSTTVLSFEDKLADLSNEKWISDAIENSLDIVTNSNGQVKAFPFAVEGVGLIYNNIVLKEAGVDASSIRTISQLEDAFKKIESTDKSPVTLSGLDWSLGGNFMPISYVTQAESSDDINNYFEELLNGNVNLMENTKFNGLIDTLDLLKKYNIDSKDPLATTYEKNQQYIGSGDVGFWFMGNWTWPQISEFAESNEDFGYIGVPISNNENDYGNGSILASPTKYLCIDATNNSVEQQEASKKFLDWLVYSESGQEFMVNDSNLIMAFNNVTLEPVDPLSKAVKTMVTNGDSIPFTYAKVPTDQGGEVGALLQKYIADQCTREELAQAIESYWKSKR